MQRITIDPRADWRGELAELGYSWHTDAGTPYWNEGAYYRFSPGEITGLTKAAETVHKLYIDATQRVIDRRLWPLIGIDTKVADKIVQWWDADMLTLYGRMDFILDRYGQWKLLEYNADTPGNVFETAIVQRNWRDQRFPDSDQFNTLPEAMTERWRELHRGRTDNRLHVVADGGSPEDMENAQFVGSCAGAAGFRSIFLPMQQIGQSEGKFYDETDQQMVFIYKQYPWEWILRDAFGQFVDPDKCWWVEPAWKMAFQCKGLLPILWDLYTEHENLLPAYTNAADLGSLSYVRKPIFGRQGESIQIYEGTGKLIAEHPGTYGEDGYIYQAYEAGPVYDGYHPIVGVWIVTDKAVAVSVREERGLITVNNSSFVPHIIG